MASKEKREKRESSSSEPADQNVDLYSNLSDIDDEQVDSSQFTIMLYNKIKSVFCRGRAKNMNKVVNLPSSNLARKEQAANSANTSVVRSFDNHNASLEILRR